MPLGESDLNYTSAMQSVAGDHFDELYSGVDEIIFTDFPDYANVGDSAIALGQLKYFEQENIRVRGTYCIASLHEDVLTSDVPVMINGGGSVAGLYPVIDRHRYKLSETLGDDVLLIQAPQSVFFTSERARQEFRSKFIARHRLRMAVRDQRSVERLDGLVPNLFIAPDAVHFLGEITGNDPTEALVVLARTDSESVRSSTVNVGVDWLRDDRKGRLGTALRWRSEKLHYKLNLNLSNEAWKKKAERRLQRGVGILSRGQIIVTDRLHAMLIGLQMGRRVVAVDNNTGKLSAYASTWLNRPDIPLSFAPDLGSAIEEANALL